ncbi:MAG: cation:proton antiporter [Bacilli bacterium]|nr:cation:proton antiporter [Bacilli bacterium]
MNQFLYLAIAIAIALLSSRLMKKIKLPNVTGYLITGILVGPYVLGLAFNGGNFTNDPSQNTILEFVHSLGWVSDVALGFIAFTIGSSFKLSALKMVGPKVIAITVFEALGGSLLVLAGLSIAHFIWPTYIGWELVITLGAIAAATAPAATLMVIKQYHAHGPLVNTLLPVVALDDAAALMLFAVLFSVAKTVIGTSSFSVLTSIVKPLLEIVISLGFGALIGVVISFTCNFFRSRANRLIISMASILLCIGLYKLFGTIHLFGETIELSSLLMCMMVGAAFVNLRKDSIRTFDRIDYFTPPVFMLFFVLSGAELDLTIFANELAIYIIIAAAFYVIFRAVGKWLGAFSGAVITRAEPTVKKYLGFTLIPQAGVAIGLATTASRIFGSSSIVEVQEAGVMILAVILTSTLIYELVGPGITKVALSKAGEIPANAKPAPVAK